MSAERAVIFPNRCCLTCRRSDSAERRLTSRWGSSKVRPFHGPAPAGNRGKYPTFGQMIVFDHLS